ncbi:MULTISPECIES: SRPBCC family protein [unclassified Curtobacterium]|uniref:SRPBCC family protein n=1 Tax=unclassified Curtobacterium TaxID=257496 RepID=UPI00034881CF|nr:SRPBCC family protein [Curtobacterium sp. B18]
MAATTTIERDVVIAAPASTILPHLVDLHRWVDWSPWEGRDPELHREYGGTLGAVGSTYAWKGNRKAGSGDMVVRRVTADEVEIGLRFTAPFASSSTTAFRLDEVPGGTRVVWTMTSPVTVMSRIVNLVMNMERFIGGDFEKGLAQLKVVVER